MKGQFIRKYDLNQHFFDVIDTQEKAYFLGVLYADGYNNVKRNSVVLSLHEDDKELLEKLNKLIYTNKDLLYVVQKNSANQFRLNIHSSCISQRLIELGCAQAKTHILKFPTEEQVPKHLIRHFVRGYFDGDGSICNYKTGVQQYSKSVFSIVSTEEFLNELQNFLITELGFSKTKLLIRFPDRKNSIRSLVGSGRKKCKTLGEWMYKDASIFLDRKKQKFDEL